VVTALDEVAAAAGLFAGQALADAQAVLPGVGLVPADAEGDAGFLRRLGVWAMRFTPLVAVEGVEGLLLDVTGCAHLFGGEAALLAEVAGRLERQGVSVCGALAGAPLAAMALARAGVAGVVAEGGEARAVAPLPLSAIGVEEALIGRLHAVGLRHVGAVAAQPRPGLVRRFGAGLAARLDEIAGHRARPIEPLQPPPEFTAVRIFPEPIATRESIEAALDGEAAKPPPCLSAASQGREWRPPLRATRAGEGRGGGDLPSDDLSGTANFSAASPPQPGLLSEIAQKLLAAGRGARRVVLRADRADGVVQRIAIGTGIATREVRHLRQLLARQLDRLEPDCGYDRLALDVVQSDPLHAEQAGLDAAGGATQGAALAELLDRLSQRVAVWRPAPQRSHWPERAVSRASPFGDVTVPAGWAARPRPVRLLRRPIPIRVMAVLPDEPPFQLRLGRQGHRVLRAEGPERFEPEWWRDRADRLFRDYYRVELSSGARLWVCRAGFARPDQEARWFLHGYFA